MSDDLDRLASNGSDPKNLTFFMGAISQRLKNGNEILIQHKEEISGLKTSVNKIDNKLNLITKESELKRNGCDQKFENNDQQIKIIDKKLSRDYDAINDVKEKLKIKQGIKKESRANIHFIIYVLTFLLLMGSFAFSIFIFKNNNNNAKNISVTITKEAVKEIIKEQKLANGGESHGRDSD